jgi:hypothetical protein
MDDGIRTPAETGIFLFTVKSKSILGTASGYVSPQVNIPALIPSTSIIELKNAWNYISVPPYFVITQCLRRSKSLPSARQNVFMIT